MKAKFHCQQAGNAELLHCNVELVVDCLKDLKRGKAAGHDELTAEHLLHAHPVLVTLLSLLFNMLAVHGMVPRDFDKAIIIPLTKNSDSEKPSWGNYNQPSV